MKTKTQHNYLKNGCKGKIQKRESGGLNEFYSELVMMHLIQL